LAILYTSASGRDVRTHSYSAGHTFNECNRKFSLARRKGWRRREQKASFEFGKAIEDAIQYYHDDGMKTGTAVAKFGALWTPVQHATGLTYSKKEKNWTSVLDMGLELMWKYEEQFPSFGLSDIKFQLNYEKEVFPGDPTYGDLKFTAYIDMHAKRNGCPIIVDIKTAAASFPERPGMLRLDDQLRTYSWVTGVPDVAFLVFVKGKTPRVQFLTDTVPEEDRLEAGRIVGRDMVAIVEANKADFFPKIPGVRFPNNHCTFCEMLGICTGDDKLRDEKLVNISAMPTEKDWLDTLGEEE